MHGALFRAKRSLMSGQRFPGRRHDYQCERDYRRGPGRTGEGSFVADDKDGKGIEGEKREAAACERYSFGFSVFFPA